MRQRNHRPIVVVKAGLKRVRRIGFDEFPIGIEIQIEPAISQG
jgi:hypothetical protein